MKNGPVFLTLDIGTGGCKSVAFDAEGRALGSGYCEYPIECPRPGWAEQDPLVWWEAAAKAAREACACGSTDADGPGGGASSCLASRVVSVSVSSQREGVVPVGADGQVLSRCIIWLDTRTSEQAEEIARRIPAAQVLRTTGSMVSPVFSAAKIMWIRENQPDVYARTHRFLQAEDFILFKLTGEFVTEESIASRTMLFDVTRRAWASWIFDALDLDEGRMPRIVPPGTAVGTLTPEAADRLGLRSGILVVAAGGDQQCGLLGVGGTDDSRCSVSLGTSTSVCLTVDRPLIAEDVHISCGCAAVPRMWALEAPIWTSGVLLRWYRDEFGQEEMRRAEEAGASVYDVMMQQAAAVPAGCDGLMLLPHFTGAGSPRWDPDARGVIYGLTLSHGRAHLVRAIVEGIAHEIAEIIEALASLGASPGGLVLTGGGARNAVFRQIIADVAGRPVLLPRCTQEAVSLGSAILATVATGVHGSLADAVESMAGVLPAEAPDPATSSVYQEYREIRRALREHTSSLGPMLRRARESTKVQV